MEAADRTAERTGAALAAAYSLPAYNSAYERVARDFEELTAQLGRDLQEQTHGVTAASNWAIAEKLEARRLPTGTTT